MIDPDAEALVTLNDALSLLPTRRGRRIHCSTLYRWASRGIRGVRLETLRVGGSLFTSREALRRFLLAQNTPRKLTASPPPPVAPDDEEREADELGL